MGCAIKKMDQLDYDDIIRPPLLSKLKNSRVKTGLFPEGEIFYLRNYKELQKENIPKNNNKGIMSYDVVITELSVEYKFSRPELMHEFKGSVIKLYHSGISLDNEFNFIGQTEEYEDNDLLFQKKFQMNYYFHKMQIIKIEIDIKIFKS